MTSDNKPQVAKLTHTMNCASWTYSKGFEVNAEECTCGLLYRKLIAQQAAELAWAQEDRAHLLTCMSILREDVASMQAELATLRAQVKRLSAPVSDQNYHFTADEVEAAVVGTDNVKCEIRRFLHHSTSGIQWSLYRAIATIIHSRQSPQKEESNDGK